MVLALSAWFGGFRPMTTVQLQTSFLRPVPADAGEVIITCRVLRCGRTLAYGEVELTLPDGTLFAHATTTYALIGDGRAG
jgi:acyl-coenzyme A thioesterase PaaI-like protein